MTTCEHVHGNLDDLVDGTLADSEAAVVRNHLAVCAPCRRAVEEATELRRHVRALPTQVAPTRDLWPGIALRIEAERVVPLTRRRPSWSQRLRWLAAAAALVVVSSAVTAYLVSQRPTPMTASQEVDSGAVRAALRPAQASFRSARATLLDALEQRRASLDPQTLRVVDENLAIIDDSIARISSAIGRDPDNRELARLLSGAYRREIDLLQRAAELPISQGGET